jgi:ABC-type uncharacterized transport system permease subunit
MNHDYQFSGMYNIEINGQHIIGAILSYYFLASCHQQYQQAATCACECVITLAPFTARPLSSVWQ